jgi:permuted papain-like amidase YaeF/Yiix C92 family enzyme
MTTFMIENFASAFPAVNVLPYAHLRSAIRSGDILLCSGNSPFSRMIQQATQSVWSHVGFIIQLDIIDRIMVLESVESIGVRTVPLSQYALNYQGTHQGYPGRVLIARHAQFQPDQITRLSRHAVDLLGTPYHTGEIIQIAARIGGHALHMKPPVMDNTPVKKAYICSEYAAECYRSVGIIIPGNSAGFIAPADFARDPQVKPLAFIQTLST